MRAGESQRGGGSRAWKAVRALSRVAGRERTAAVIVVACLSVVAAGTVWTMWRAAPRAEGSDESSARPPVEEVAEQQPPLPDQQISVEDRPVPAVSGGVASVSRSTRRGAREVTWAAPDPEIVGAFAALQAALPGIPVYAPDRLPAGAGLAGWASDAGEGEARGRVVVWAREGLLAFYAGMSDDLEELPSEPCGLVNGRPAVIRRVLGGHLVQWRDHTVLYGIYGRGLTADAVTRTAHGALPLPTVSAPGP